MYKDVYIRGERLGTCKLTGKNGIYVKSHIIPKALTRPSKPGNQFFQPDPLNKNKRYIRRSDSWYDKTIVTREGEDYLSELDSHAINELRELGLLWSSERIRPPASSSQQELAVVQFKAPDKIRKFFLSLLWRSAVSSLPEFREINLPICKIERLRQILIGEQQDDLSFFPTTLVQLPFKGPAHNFIPLKQELGNSGKEIYRFYMDGLIAHMHLSDPTLAVVVDPLPYDHPMFIGHKDTIVIQIDTDTSFQIENLRKLCSDFM
jgi:hypothetical protein